MDIKMVPVNIRKKLLSQQASKLLNNLDSNDANDGDQHYTFPKASNGHPLPFKVPVNNEVGLSLIGDGEAVISKKDDTDHHSYPSVITSGGETPTPPSSDWIQDQLKLFDSANSDVMRIAMIEMGIIGAICGALVITVILVMVLAFKSLSLPRCCVRSGRSRGDLPKHQYNDNKNNYYNDKYPVGVSSNV